MSTYTITINPKAVPVELLRQCHCSVCRGVVDPKPSTDNFLLNPQSYYDYFYWCERQKWDALAHDHSAQTQGGE